MFKRSVSQSDIFLINKIIFPTSELVIFFGVDFEIKTEPSNKVNVLNIQDKIELTQFIRTNKTFFSLVNYSDTDLTNLENQRLLLGLLDFSNISKAGHQPYFYINNPDGSMRWFFPKANKNPCFLNLYNGSGWKANLFVAASKLLTKVKGLSILAHGHFSVYYNRQGGVKTNFPTVAFDDFAVFTGTIGENRKAIIALSDKGSATQFIKIPLTKSSARLVKNEFLQLSKLGTFTYHSTILPTAKFRDDQIMVSNISPKQKSKDQQWSSVHWQSLAELYRNSYQRKPLINTSFWKTIEAGIHFLNQPLSIINELSENKISLLKKYVKKIHEEIDPASLYSLGIGHGDFTPWNMYVGNGQLHIYDWEMSQPDFPLLFDAYHYFFQKGILINRENYSTIHKNLQTQFQQKDAQQILATYRLEETPYYQLYLLYIVSYYLPKYIVQPKLHDQVHWLISTWLEALENLPDTTTVALRQHIQ